MNPDDQKMLDFPLAAEWLAEVGAARQGPNDVPIWSESWTEARAEWARDMLALADRTGFLAAVPTDARGWLEEIQQRKAA